MHQKPITYSISILSPFTSAVFLQAECTYGQSVHMHGWITCGRCKPNMGRDIYDQNVPMGSVHVPLSGYHKYRLEEKM